MTKLVLYSGGQTAKNELLHEALSKLAGSHARKSFTYVPFCFDGYRAFFERTARRYRPFGFSKFQCLHVDQNPSKSEIASALSSDVVYLAGGNTFYFLHHLRRSGVFEKLKKYSKQGGVLAGLSAGAIILTPQISFAAYPEYTADSNEVNLKNWKGLALAPFEFFPHYTDTKVNRTTLQKYTKQCPHPVIAAADGGGVVVDGPKLQFFGQTQLLVRDL